MKEREWLYNRYIKEEYSTTDIGRMCNVSSRTISEWLKKYNIKARIGNSTIRGKKIASEGMKKYYKKYGHHLKNRFGKESNNYKGGKPWFSKSTEYYRIQIRGKRMPYHVYIWLKKNKMDKIPEGYCVHHIDFNKKNNNISNLMLIKWGKHIALHRKFNKTGEIDYFVK